MQGLRLPGKGGNGPLIVEALQKDLDYWCNRLTQTLVAGDSRDAQRDTKIRDAIRAEQDRRAKGGAPAVAAQPQQSTALAPRVSMADIIGTFTDAVELNDRLLKASESMNLISPATSVGHLPMGIAISITAVPVNIETDTYPLQGKFGLSKHVLDKIAMQLGISWDANQSGRLDDGSDPRYCRYRVVGSYLSLDARELSVSDVKELDLRDGSPQIEALQEQARRKAVKTGEQIRDIHDQLSELRLHILSHCATKARNRAIRQFGVKTSYTQQELSKPFVAVRPLFTGYAPDPDIQRMFASRIADAFLGGSRALYGRSSPSLPAPRDSMERQPPPPRRAPVDDDSFTTTGDHHEREADDAYESWGSEEDAKGMVY